MCDKKTVRKCAVIFSQFFMTLYFIEIQLNPGRAAALSGSLPADRYLLPIASLPLCTKILRLRLRMTGRAGRKSRNALASLIHGGGGTAIEVEGDAAFGGI